jgi:DNA-binding transcriptional ArsR family regulator
MPPADDRIPDLSAITLVDVLKAVADPIRLRIVQTLADGDSHGKCGQHWDFGVHKSTMSHHFRLLREAGLTRTTVTGRTHTIELRRDELNVHFPGLIDALTKPADRGTKLLKFPAAPADHAESPGLPCACEEDRAGGRDG